MSKKPSFDDLLCYCDTRMRTYLIVRLRSCVSRVAHLIQNMTFYFCGVV